jgi:hypothetical protein
MRPSVGTRRMLRVNTRLEKSSQKAAKGHIDIGRKACFDGTAYGPR